MSAVAPARACAYRVVRRVFEDGAYADRALAAEGTGLDGRDRALAMRIAYGAVQRRATLDHVIAALSGRGVDRLDAPVLAALRIGLAQILYLDSVPGYAAVGESVELAKRAGQGRGAGLVNAVLRRAVREGRELIAALDDADPAGAALAHSVPLWLAELWWRELGAESARALLRVVNTPAEASLRVNSLVTSRAAVLAALPEPAGAEPAAPVAVAGGLELHEGIALHGPFDAHGSALWEAGALMPQSRGSMAVARALDPEPGAAVLDLCAAPGGKTTHLAALTGGLSEIVAVERHPGRAAALERTCARMHAGRVRVEVGDAATPRPAGETYPFVLADPPCSGLGTLQSRPDLRWRAAPEAIAELAEIQARILTAAAAATAPGGVLVYSVCTISRAESTRAVAGFLAGATDFTLRFEHQLRPDRDGTDGFYIARLERAP